MTIRARPLVAGLTCLGLGAASALCAGAATAAEADVVIGVPSWASARATANIIKVVLEDRLGLSVAITEMSNQDAFAGMDAGTVQVHPEVWMPNLAQLTEEYVHKRGTVRESPHQVTATQRICTSKETADTLDVHSVDDLANPAKAALFDTDFDAKGEIWIGDASWTSTAIEKIRAKSYGYDQTMTLLEAPEDIALATVDAAIAVGKPVVFYCYEPHHIFALHDIVVLDEPAYDPAKWRIVLPADDPDWLAKSEAPVAWDKSHFQIDYAASLEEQKPAAAKVLGAIEFDADAVSAMSYALMVERVEPYAFAKTWVEEHSAVVDSWVEGVAP